MNEKNSVALDESLYATLRIITIFLNADGRVHSKELDWFKWLIKNRVTEQSHITGLMNDLVNPPDLEELLMQVNRDDRQRLIAWARIAVSVDGQISLAEEKLYDRLILLNDQSDLEISNRSLGHAVLESHGRLNFWRELTDLSVHLNQTLKVREIFFHNWLIFNGFLRFKKFYIGLFIFSMLIALVVRMFI